MSKNYIFSSESVGEGHPDKVCDTISDAILDACLAQDPRSRVACETFVKSNVVVVGGEITTKSRFDYNNVIRPAIRGIGYVNDDDVFHADKVFINNYLTRQSPDIAQGVDAREAEGKGTAEQGAGDQGLMFGYACNETPELMPAPIMYAHRLGRELTRIRKSGKVKWLRPDAKSQVTVQYENGKPVGITSVVVSTQHSADVKHKTIHDFIVRNVVKKVLPARMLNRETEYLINPTGRFVVGGPQGDSGLTGRKIIVGHPQPVSVAVDTFGTGLISDEKITEAIRQVFSFKPADIVKHLKLQRPIFSKTTNYGHFGKVDDLDSITWERTDKVAALKRAAR